MWPYPWTHVGTPSHLGHMDRVAATMPSKAHAAAAQEAPDIGQWEGQDVPLVRPSSCNVKGGIPSSRRHLPTYNDWKMNERSVAVLYPAATVVNDIEGTQYVTASPVLPSVYMLIHKVRKGEIVCNSDNSVVQPQQTTPEVRAARANL